MSANDNFNQKQQQSLNKHWLNIEIYVKNNDPNLLQGLEQWLELNLVTEAQVINVCHQYLSCKLPTVNATKPNLLSNKIKL